MVFIIANEDTNNEPFNFCLGLARYSIIKVAYV